jgi:hypothetical protein
MCNNIYIYIYIFNVVLLGPNHVWLKIVLDDTYVPVPM